MKLSRGVDFSRLVQKRHRIHSVTIEIIMKKYLTSIGEAAKEIFKASFIFFLLFFTIDQFNPGYISNFLNLSYLLIFSLICGIISLIWSPQVEEPQAQGWPKYIPPSFIIILAFLLVWNLTSSMGGWSWLLGVVSALVVGLVWWNLDDRETEKLNN